MSKILIWDIETAGFPGGFHADRGWVVCIAYKWLGESKTHILRLDQYKNWDKNPADDKKLLQDFVKVYNEAQMTVAHYGAKFDRRFVEGRLLINNLGPLPETKMIDTCLIARSKFKFSSNRLKHLADLLGCDNQKAPNDFPYAWMKVMRGGSVGKKALVGMGEYCKQDVNTLEDVYMRIRNRIQIHPHIGAINGLDKKCSCRICGSEKLKKNGIRYTASGMKRQELQCKDCGSYHRIPVK